MDLTELRELRKKATQGKWHVSDFAIHGEPKAEENATFIAALVNWFDLPSTQAKLDQGERKDLVRASFLESFLSGDDQPESNARDAESVPMEIVQELAAIGNAVCDLHQYRNAPDNLPLMGWDNTRLTLGTVRKCRAIAARREGDENG